MCSFLHTVCKSSTKARKLIVAWLSYNQFSTQSHLLVCLSIFELLSPGGSSARELKITHPLVKHLILLEHFDPSELKCIIYSKINFLIVMRFSKLAKLWQKKYILAGHSGINFLCVCTTHQNVKLMIENNKLGGVLTEGYSRHCLAQVCNQIV